MVSGEVPTTDNGEVGPVAENESPWTKMAKEAPPFRHGEKSNDALDTSEEEMNTNPLSYYESDNIPKNQNGDLMLDPNVGPLSRDQNWINQIIESQIITTREDVGFIMDAERIKLSNGDEVNSELLKRCLAVDAYYSCAKHNLQKDSSFLGIIRATELVNGDVGRGDAIQNKRDLVKGLVALKESGQLDGISDIEKKRLKEFKEMVSPEAFAERTYGTQYETTVDGKQCVLPVEDMLTFLSLPPDKLKEICTTDPDAKIGQLSKTEFAYAAAEYLKKNNVMQNYAFPDKLEKRMQYLMDGRYIDFSAANKLLETEDTLYEKANLNPELKDAVLEQMPSDISGLEKAAYIYAKMCTMLTYDNKFYAANQKGEAAEKHKSLDYIEQITPQNNEVVCFEFNMIYAKLLHEQGLHFKSDYRNMMGEDYGEGHADLAFRDGKFIVKADSVSGILGGDIARAKLGLPFIGFECESKNKRTQQEFQDSVSRMYELVQQQEREKSPWDEYDLLTENLKPVEFDEKESILLEKLKTTSLRGIDAMTYALQLRKALFSEQELKDNVSIVILRNNEVAGQGPKLEAGAVIAMNGSNIDERPNKTSYYYLSSDCELTSLTLEDIKTKLDDGTFEYIEREDPKIPGTVDSINNEEEQ